MDAYTDKITEDDLIGYLLRIGREHLKKKNLMKAKIAFEHAYKKSTRMGVDTTVFESLVLMARVSIACKDLNSASTYLDKAVSCRQKPQYMTGYAHCLRAIVHHSMGSLMQSAKEHDQALALFEDANLSTSIVADEATIAGICHAAIQKYKNAANKFDEAAKIYLDNRQLDQLAKVLSRKSQCMVGQKKIPEALELCAEAFELSSKLEQNFSTINLYNELGLTYTQCKRYKDARICFEKALEAAKSDQSDFPSVKLAAIYQNLGATCNSIGDYEKSVFFSESAATIFGQQGIRTSQCHCFLNIAYSHAKVGNLDSCEEAYSHALLAAKDLGSKRDHWQALEGLAGVAAANGSNAKAISLYKKALGICADMYSSSTEQDRLLTKLTLMLQRTAGVSDQALSPQQSRVEGIKQGEIGLQSHEMRPPRSPILASQNSSSSHHRIINLKPNRVVSSSVTNQITLRERKTDVNRSSDSVQGPLKEAEARTQARKKSRRKRKTSRRHREHHPVHQNLYLVSRGLGTYSNDPEGPVQLSRDRNTITINEPSHRRQDDGTENKGLYIKGLAVTIDDPTEPLVSAKNVQLDEVDSQTLQLRPMSRQIAYRKSTLIDTDVIEAGYMSLHSVTDNAGESYNYDEESDSDSYAPRQSRKRDDQVSHTDSVKDLYDCEEEIDDSEDSVSASIELTGVENRSPLTNRKGLNQPNEEKDLLEKSLTSNESQDEISIGKDHYREPTHKMPLNGKTPPTKTSKHLKRHSNLTTESLLATENKSSSSGIPSGTLQDSTIHDHDHHDDDEEADNRQMHEYYYKHLESTNSSDDYDTSSYEKKAMDFETDSNIDIITPASKDTHKNKMHETYEKPDDMDSADEAKIYETTDPIYATISHAETSIPAHRAPPLLPPRRKVSIQEKVDSDSVGIQDTAETRSDREQKLYKKHLELKRSPPDSRSPDKSTKQPQKSGACIVM